MQTEPVWLPRLVVACQLLAGRVTERLGSADDLRTFQQALTRFLGTPADPGNYRAVQILLALVTGTPLFAERVFEELRKYDGDPAKRLLDLANLVSADSTWQTTSDALREFCRGDGNLPLGALKDVSGLVARYSLHNMVIQTPGEAGLG